MKFSYRWLSELVPGFDADPRELQRLITMKTAECEGIEPLEGTPAPDWIIEIDNKSLTHRPDLWGHYGMAREVAALTAKLLKDPVNAQLLPTGTGAIAVEISDYKRCSRYSALVFEDVRVGPSPEWLQSRLESVDLKPIANIVDVTNYVLAELPQPMHAFDRDKLSGGTIFVRNAQPGERLHALNGETYTLTEADLVIADASCAIALAGVIGGVETAISETTTRVVLESANFEASGVRLTSARHKLRTDASIRFEKSLDPENTTRGLARAMELFHEVSPGIRVIGGVVDRRGPLPRREPIALPINFVARKLGKEVKQEQICEILHALGFEPRETAPSLLTVTVPSWRATKDVAIKDDLVEEIGRMMGYGEIEPTAPLVACTLPPENPMRSYLREQRAQLSGQGFTEVYNYSFTKEIELAPFELPIESHIAVRNPIASELTHLRRSLLPGLYKNVADNVRHYSEFRLFEIGNEIHPRAGTDLPQEVNHLAAVLYNAHADEQDFFELKRVVECLFSGARLTAVEARGYEHPTRTAQIDWRGSTLGRLFELHPSLLERGGIEGRAFLFDVDLEMAQRTDAARRIQYAPLRKYPTSGFDLSVVTALRTPVARVQNDLTKLAGTDLAMIDFIRQYDGPPLAAGQKSVTFHLEVGAGDHTLDAEEVTAIRNRMMDGMRALRYDFRG